MNIDNSYQLHAALAVVQAASADAARPTTTQESEFSRSTVDVTTTFGHHVKHASKPLNHRSLRVGRRGKSTVPDHADSAEHAEQADHAGPVEQREKLEQWFDQMGHSGQRSLTEVARQAGVILQKEPSLEDLVKLTGDDPARTDVVLQRLIQQSEAQDGGDDAQHGLAIRARGYLAQLRKRFAGEIQAGLNIVQVLQEQGADAEVRQAVRRLYYDTVVLKQSLTGMLQALLGLFGEKDFANGLATMRVALAADIAAERPSQPNSKLRILLLGLSASTRLSSVLERCVTLLESRQQKQSTAGLTAVALLQRMLSFAAGGITAVEGRRIALELGGKAERDQLVSLNQLYGILKELPLLLWRDGKSRQKALNGLLELMAERSAAEPRAATAQPIRVRIGA